MFVETGTNWRWPAMLGLALSALGLLPAPALSQQSTAAKPASDAAVRIERDGITLELAPLPREAVEAFMVGRGLSVADAAIAAERGCIFRSAIGNAATDPGGPELRLKLSDWRISPDAGGAPRPPLLRTDWDAFWHARELAEASAVAFHWALFPPEQIFAPTDHNWGLMTFGLPPGAKFSLDVTWMIGSKVHSGRFDGLSCAP